VPASSIVRISYVEQRNRHFLPKDSGFWRVDFEKKSLFRASGVFHTSSIGKGFLTKDTVAFWRVDFEEKSLFRASGVFHTSSEEAGTFCQKIAIFGE